MSGLLALLDDVAAIAKIAASSLDDVAAQAAKAGAKAAGAVIDDAAVTPKYVLGFEASRELPIIWKIAKGSFKNKLLYLLPAAMLLNTYAPAAISPLLMLGGSYLCFEGGEKIYHVLRGHADSHDDGHDTVTETASEELDGLVQDMAHLEEEKAAGAIKTDFILSAEIMTIALAEIPPSNIWMEAATLGIVGIGITVVVYGSVALLVKIDDVGLFLSSNGRLSATRAFGRFLVRAMPGFMSLLSKVGTAAMLWVGGSIIIHGLKELGFGWLEHNIHELAMAAAHAVPVSWQDAVAWSATAAMDGIVGLALGLALIPVVTKVITPLWRLVTGKGGAGAH